MAGKVLDEAFARAIQEMGALTRQEIDAGRQYQAQQAQAGVQLSLADALLQKGLITAALKANIEKRLGPKVIGPYELVGRIGEGAMGVVYRAKVRKTGVEVALKVLPRKFAADQNYISRFMREAKAGLELEHDHVVRTVDFGDHEGTYFIALELVEGGDLGKKLKKLKVLPEADALKIVHEVALGLQHAHERGLVHRDIKPANIMFGKDGKAKLSDFGLVKYTDPEASHLTQTGMTVGTPHYLAPEQAKGEKDVDIRADIYALGATLYHLVTGRPPFEGSSVGEVIMKHLTAELQPPDEITPGLSEGCVALIEKMMAKAREDRYATPAQLIADMERVRAGEMPTALLEAGRSSVAVSAKRMERLRSAGGSAGVAERSRVPPANVRQPFQADEPLAGRRAAVRDAGQAGKPDVHRGTDRHARIAGRRPTQAVEQESKPRKGASPLLIVAGVAALLILVPVLYLLLGQGAPVPSSSKSPPTPTEGHEPLPIPPDTSADGRPVSNPVDRTWPLHDGKEPIADYAKRVGLPPTETLDLGDGVKMEFVLVPAGAFMMGCLDSEQGREGKDRPQHMVTISRPFYMGKYEVTQGQYQKVVKQNPSEFKGQDLPVERISWDEAQFFCREAGRLTGRLVKLPTEAQWEYACRAGTKTRFNLNENADASMEEAGWYEGNAGKRTHPVGQKVSNAWGLYDMHGNVWEFCEDWFGDYASNPATDPIGPPTGTERVLRSGAFNRPARHCRSGMRRWPGYYSTNHGFRCVLEPVFTAFSGGPDAGPQVSSLTAVQNRPGMRR